MKSYIHNIGMSKCHASYRACFFLLKDFIRSFLATFRINSVLIFLIFSSTGLASAFGGVINAHTIHPAVIEYNSYNHGLEKEFNLLQSEVHKNKALAPAVSLEITANAESITQAGQTVVYTYTVNNIGDETLTEVEVVDDVFESIVLTSTTIEPEGSAFGTYDYTISQDDIDARDNIVNNATVSTAEGAEGSNSISIDVIQLPEVTVTKSALTMEYNSVGDIITYTIGVVNSGNTTLTDLSVEDGLTGFEEIIPNLEPKARQNFSTTYEIRQPDISTGSVTNTVTVSDGATVNASAEETIFAELIPELTLTKTASPNTYDEIGDEINFTIVVENTGDVALANIEVTDPLIQLEETIASFGAGQTRSFNGSYNVTQADLNNGSLSNTASALGTDPEGVTVESSDAVTIDAIQAADLSVIKTADASTYSAVGDLIAYTVDVVNTGNVALANVAVTDPLIGLEETISSFGAGETQSYNGSYNITQADLNNGSLSNTASASGTDPDGVTVEDSDAVTIDATLAAGISVTKTANPTTYSTVGDAIAYAVELENTGNVALANVAVTDPLIGLEQTITSFGPGETQSYDGSYNITQADLNNGSLSNTASASGTDPDGVTVEDSDVITINAIQAGALTVTKTANASAYSAVDDLITYTIDVVNTGNVALANVTVTDSLIELEQTISNFGAGETQSFNGSYNITQTDLNNGSLSNTASASGTDPDGVTVEDSDAVTIEATLAAGISVTKTADASTYDTVGDVIAYIIDVANTGNVALANVTLTDPLLELEQTIASLEAGETRRFNDSYTITQADLNNGTLSNTASASGTDPNGDIVEDSDVITISANLAPGLSVTKTADASTYNAAGDVITYTIEVVNTGNVALANVTVTDPLLELSESIASLEAGADRRFIGNYTITQVDLNNGSLSNTASASASDPNGDTVEDSDVVTINASLAPGLSVTKTANASSFNAVGDVIVFTIDVANTGNVALTNITITDPLIELEQTIPNLGAGEIRRLDGNYTITQTDLNNGSLSNTASASGTDPNGDTVEDSDVVTLNANLAPGLSVTKTADVSTYNAVGDVIAYTIEVENTGNVALANVTVTDPLINLEQTITGLGAGESQEFNGNYTITQDDLNTGSLSNTASASGTDPDGETVEGSDAVTVNASLAPGLSVTKLADASSYNAVGDVIAYTIEVANTGNVTIDNITVTDPLINLEQTIPELDAGGTRRFNGTYTITQTDLNNGSLSNTATASGTDPDGNTVEGSDVVTLTASLTPGLSLTKTASPTTYNSVGDVITYTISVENTGNVVLSNVNVSDQLLEMEESVGNLAAGATESFEGSYTITQVDLNNGSLTNTAYVEATEPDGDVLTDTDQAVVTASQNPNLSVNKTASPITYDSVGDEITYTIVVENTGNLVLASVVVTDQLLDFTENIAVLAPGASQTYTETFAINQSHLNSGSITNTVSVTGLGSAGVIVNDTDDATVTAIQRPALEVSKTAAQESYKAVGDEIDYTIVVENTGNVTVTDITVNDPLVQMNQSIGNLNPGDSESISVVYAVTQADLDEGTVINTVSVTGNHGGVTIEADGEAVVSALYPPIANDDTSSDHLSGNAVVVDVLENDLLNDGSPALPGLVTVDLNQETNGVQSELVVQNEGTWNYNTQSGEVTFTPQPGFTTDPGSITYLLTEISTGLSDNASVTVDYNEGEPFAFNDISTGNVPGEPVTINIIANDKLSDGSAATSQLTTIDIDVSQSGIQTTLSVPGEGNWAYNQETGEATFTPLPGFTTDPSPVTYGLTENLTGLSDGGTIIIGYSEQAPIAADDVISGLTPGEEATVNILNNDELSDGTEALPELVIIDIDLNRAGVQDELEIAGEGSWNLDSSTGNITFTPIPGFSGSTEPVIYRLTEIITGLGDNASIIFGYSEEAPLAVDDNSSGNQPGTEVSVNILENDLLSDGTPASPDLVTVDIDSAEEGVQHELFVDGQGTWLYNAVNGAVIFTPQSGFLDDPTPVSYTLCTIWNSEICSEAEVVIDYGQDALSASIGFVKTGVYNVDEETINYTFEVTNTGNLPVWNITITDAKIGVNNLPVVPDTLQPGATGSVTAIYEVSQSDKNSGSVTNTATATGIGSNGEQIEDISGGTVDDDEPTVTPLIQAPSISIEKQAVMFTAEAILNEIIDFRIIVTNNGNVILNNVTVEDPLTGFEQDVGQLLPANSVEYIIEYTVQPEDEINGEFENMAIATGIAPDGSEVTDSSSVVVEVEQCEMVIPNGFSPNDDGIQDTWRIKCLEKYPNARVEIFNRWGNRVYEKRNYGNTDVHGVADAWWDGYSTNKRTFGDGKLPAGTYYYILYLQDGQEPLNGYIFLNR